MSSKEDYSVRSGKRSSKQIMSRIDHSCHYSPSMFGMASNLKGNGVKIAILDTGKPKHKDIKNIGECVDMVESPKGCEDSYGHATMVAGVLGSNNPKTIVGIAPESQLLFAKVANSTGKCCFNSVVASVLWSIIKQVDIILISLSSDSDCPLLHDAIKKAFNSGICIIAASGKNSDKIEYPAAYPEVLAVGKKSSRSKSKQFEVTGDLGVNMCLPSNDIYTTYLNNKYTKASGTSLIASIGSGLAALSIEKQKIKNESINPKTIYSNISSLQLRSKDM